MIRSFFRFIFHVVYGMFAFFGLGMIILVLILSFSVTYFGFGPFAPVSKQLKHDSVLTLTLNGSYVEHEDSKGIETLLVGKNHSLFNLTRSIIHAANDPKIKGLVMRLELTSLGIAQIQELRDAILEFRKSGKPTWFYTESFELHGTGFYYLASAFEQIWIQPLGVINLLGLSMQVPFAKGALEKLDIKYEVVQKKEYKSYPEMFTRDDFSEANREASQAVIDSILSQIVEGIAKERKLPHEQVRLLINNGPYFTEEALAVRLIDRIDYRQNLLPFIKEKLGHDIAFLKISSYLHTLPIKHAGEKVALIFGSGTIISEVNLSALDDKFLGANATYNAFQLAINDPDVKSIVYRIDSTGGSPTASETIYSIIQYAKEHAKKPVIISMSDAAASGGYWVSVAGTKIVAQPATLTGSIGTFGGKFNLSGFFEKLGIKWAHVTTSDNATMWSMTESFTPAQWIKFNAYTDQIYDGFTSRVAKGRKLTPEQVEKVARGRVWTGEQALALGLVDQLGSLHTALDIAKKEAGLPLEAGIQIFPRHKSFLESLFVAFESDDESVSSVGIVETTLLPLKKLMAMISLVFSKQEVLQAPLGEVR